MRIYGTPSNVLQVGVSTWANRGSGQTVGDLKRITDIGPTGGTLMIWDGTYWRVIAGIDLTVQATLVQAGALNTNEQIVQQYTLPAGILRAGRYSVIRAGWAKSGTTNAMSNARLRLGTAGTTSDAELANATSFQASSRSFCTAYWCTPTSATNLRSMGLMNKVSGFDFTISGNASTFPQDITVPDIDANALILSLSTAMGGSTDYGQVTQLLVRLEP